MSKLLVFLLNLCHHFELWMCLRNVVNSYCELVNRDTQWLLIMFRFAYLFLDFGLGIEFAVIQVIFCEEGYCIHGIEMWHLMNKGCTGYSLNISSTSHQLGTPEASRQLKISRNIPGNPKHPEHLNSEKHPNIQNISTVRNYI